MYVQYEYCISAASYNVFKGVDFCSEKLNGIICLIWVENFWIFGI